MRNKKKPGKLMRSQINGVGKDLRINYTLEVKDKKSSKTKEKT